MGIFTMVRLFLSFASAGMNYLKNKQLIDAGSAKAIADGLQKANDELRKVNEARLRFKRDPDYRRRVRESYKASNNTTD